MNRRDHTDSEPHRIEIHDVDPESGEIEWTLHHPDSCKEHTWTGEDLDGVERSYTYYECLVQVVLDEGLQDALHDLWEPKPGEIRVVGCSTYDTYTHESDAWLEIIE